MSETKIFIAFDFGTKRIGVAVGQTVTMTANPMNSLLAKDGIPEWTQILELIQTWIPSALVVGIPINMDGTSQPITGRAKLFARELLVRFDLPVYEVDERLTTVEAKETLFELGGYKALKDISVDSFAAKLMLEAWMRGSLP